MSNKRFLGHLGNSKIDLVFDREGGGFPTCISLRYPNGVQEISYSSSSFLTVTLADGRTFQSEAADSCQVHYSDNGLRVALYIRGVDEWTTGEDACDWFHTYLKPDWDGLYADFGGSLNTAPPYHFKKHYLNYLAIRRTIGRFGLFYAHLGCLSSAVGLGPEIVDGYVSGEGEMGTLGQERFLHEALSGSYISTGTFWSAAFPEYGREEILPFLAATGQYPHSPLGVQHRSTSLVHPLVPGVNDAVFRKLWKLWKPMKFSRDVQVFNDFNGTGKVSLGNSQCGSYLMVDASRRSALLLVCNFSRDTQRCLCRIDGTAMPWKKRQGGCFQLRPHTASPCEVLALPPSSELECILEPSGCTGFYFGTEADLQTCGYFADAPALSAEAKKYLRQLAEQKALREPAPLPEKVYCRIRLPLPQIPCICIEPFYSAYHEIGTLDELGHFHSLGYVTKEGVRQTPPDEGLWLWCNTASPRLCLNDLCPEGGAPHVCGPHLRASAQMLFPFFR